MAAGKSSQVNRQYKTKYALIANKRHRCLRSLAP